MVYIAVSIKVKSLDQALYDMQKAESKRPDLLELRLDYMPEGALDEKVINTLLECAGLPVIATIRHKDEAGTDEGEGYKGPEERRKELYQHAIDRGAAYIDIEGIHYHKFEKGDALVIASNHNQKGIPDNPIGVYRIFACQLRDADIYKFAFRINPETAEADYKKLMGLHEQAEKDNEKAEKEGRAEDKRLAIVIGMGKHELARKTRYDPRNHITYACIDEKEATASGQYTVEQMKELLAKQ